MTTEDDFQRMLDANPDDWQTRLVFSEWLRDRDDPRADGMQALGRSGNHAILPGERGWGMWYCDEQYTLPSDIGPMRLASDWYYAVELLIDETKEEGLRSIGYAEGVPDYWQAFNTRREAEDAAALAFAKLPAERRAELLATAPVA